MQIDVLSQNTLKLTLSRLDMFDLDIKYESLSGKNPDTKRLLSHVLRTVKLDKSAGVDFSGERLFVEAFPRPDGGCMLYISCLIEEESGKSCEKRTVRLTAPRSSLRNSNAPPPLRTDIRTEVRTEKPKKIGLLCRLDSIKELSGLCKSLSWQQTHGRLDLESALYGNSDEYRLLIASDSANDRKLISAVVSEYGELLTFEHELPFTCEHYKLLVPENAIEKMSLVL